MHGYFQLLQWYNAFTMAVSLYSERDMTVRNQLIYNVVA